MSLIEERPIRILVDFAAGVFLLNIFFVFLFRSP